MYNIIQGELLNKMYTDLSVQIYALVHVYTLRPILQLR